MARKARFLGFPLGLPFAQQILRDGGLALQEASQAPYELLRDRLKDDLALALDEPDLGARLDPKTPPDSCRDDELPLRGDRGGFERRLFHGSKSYMSKKVSQS